MSDLVAHVAHDEDGAALHDPLRFFVCSGDTYRQYEAVVESWVRTALWPWRFDPDAHGDDPRLLCVRDDWGDLVAVGAHERYAPGVRFFPVLAVHSAHHDKQIGLALMRSLLVDAAVREPDGQAMWYVDPDNRAANIISERVGADLIYDPTVVFDDEDFEDFHPAPEMGALMQYVRRL